MGGIGSRHLNNIVLLRGKLKIPIQRRDIKAFMLLPFKESGSVKVPLKSLDVNLFKNSRRIFCTLI